MSTSYPVRVDADLQPDLSRWLWLVKWVLVIPHYFVLAFLWVAFTVLSVVAFFAILVTGRYPRSVFDFNVGVLRWSWRVSYYSYGSLGTDQYPPFTLADRPDYPARLEVAYPERLSRGLVLVKWWLLAIPHYLVLGLFLGGSWYVTTAQNGRWDAPGGGLIALLVLVAAVVLLFTGRYPQSIFDLVLGLNRWVLRVAAYASLMTDEYPPFRLDLGGSEPTGTRIAMPAGGSDPFQGARPATDPPAPARPAAPPEAGPPQPLEWGAGRITAVVVGALVLLLACGLLAAGAALGVADRTVRDSQGYLMTPQATLSTPGAALVSRRVQLYADPTSAFPQGFLGKAKVTVQPAGGRPVFVGVARSAAADSYLSGVARSTVTGFEGGRARYQFYPGGTPAQPPAQMGFWAASSTGSGQQTVSWPLRTGDWTLVVMNGDASRGVTAAVRVGATVPAAVWLFISFLVAGVVLLAAAVVTLVLALRQPARSRPSPPT